MQKAIYFFLLTSLIACQNNQSSNKAIDESGLKDTTVNEKVLIKLGG